MAKRADDLRARLLEEPIEDIPAKLRVPDFERWAPKVAVHFLEAVKASGTIEDLPEFMRVPEIAALAIKEQIIRRLSDDYVVSERNRSLFPPDYLYSFRRPLPRRIVLDAAVEAGFLHHVNDPGPNP